MLNKIKRKINTLNEIFNTRAHKRVPIQTYLYYSILSMLNNKGLFISNEYKLIKHSDSQLLLNTYKYVDFNTYFELFRFGEYDLFLKNCLKEKETYNVIDLGANIGLFFSYLKKNNISVENYIAVEPFHKNFKTLQFNTFSKHTKIFSKAVWVHENGMKLTTDKTSNTNEINSKTGIKVETITLESILNELTGSKNKLLLKIDIEGSEYKVLESSKKLINKEVYAFVVEFHDVKRNKADKKYFEKLFYDFEITVEDKENGLCLVYGKKAN